MDCVIQDHTGRLGIVGIIILYIINLDKNISSVRFWILSYLEIAQVLFFYGFQRCSVYLDGKKGLRLSRCHSTSVTEPQESRHHIENHLNFKQMNKTLKAFNNLDLEFSICC